SATGRTTGRRRPAGHPCGPAGPAGEAPSAQYRRPHNHARAALLPLCAARGPLRLGKSITGMDQPPPELSIVIPAYNEERRLPETLRRVREYLSTRPACAEVIVVDDGSSDRSAAVVEEWRSKFAGLRLLSNGRNRGKGYSVRPACSRPAGGSCCSPMPTCPRRS